MIVNSISRGGTDLYIGCELLSVCVCLEMESLETQLMVAEEEASHYKKAARLWKAHYLHERTARYVSGLLELV